MPFGSIITGLGIRTSDVDCYVSLPHWVRMPPNKIVYKAKHILMAQHHIFTDLVAIPMAKVPIVKFFHVPTGRHCDISFKSPSGVQNSKLLAYLLHADERALPLAILIKYWSKVHNLTGTNLMPNYSLMLLVIFYLQQVNVLPSVLELQDSVEEFVDNWNTAFREIPNYKSTNKESLYKLIGGFFKYYRDFDFAQNIVSPYLGTPISREILKRQFLEDVPYEFSLYKHNVELGNCPNFKNDTRMCIQDPFDHSRNCCVSVFPKLADKLVALFQNGAKLFTEDANNNFLKGILTKLPVHVGVTKKKNKGLSKVQKRNQLQNNFIVKRNTNKFHMLFEEMNRKKNGKR